MGRDTTGVIGVSLKKNNDFVVEMDVVDEKAHLLSVTENGYGKRSEVAEYRYQGRGGSGVINVKVTEKNGPVVGIKSVTDADQLLLITERGQLIRIKVNGIRETGRAAQGVRVIQLEEGDRARRDREARGGGRRRRRDAGGAARWRTRARPHRPSRRRGRRTSSATTRTSRARTRSSRPRLASGRPLPPHLGRRLRLRFPTPLPAAVFSVMKSASGEP